MGDLPDWITAQANQGSLLFGTTVVQNGNYQGDVTANQSLYIHAVGTVLNTAVALEVDWYTDSTRTVLTQRQRFRCVQDAGGLSDMVLETPVYSGYAFVANQSVQTINLTVIGTGRSVSDAKILGTTLPARRFGFAGALATNTAIFTVPVDSGDADFKSNGQSLVSVISNTPGGVFCYYIDVNLVPQTLHLFDVVANTNADRIMPLAQGGVAFVFVPSAPNAAGSLTVTAVAAQI